MPVDKSFIGDNSDTFYGNYSKIGSEVKAIHDGTVTLKGAMDGLGNYFVTNGDGFNIVYQEAFGSASDIRVNIGDHVKVGGQMVLNVSIRYQLRKEK